MNTKSKTRIIWVIVLALAVFGICVFATGQANPVEALESPRSPLAPPRTLPITPQPRGLPAGARADPTPLPYGPKGMSGGDPFGNLDHDVWYNWAPIPSSTDPRLARMVSCPTDYRLYTETLGFGLGTDRIENIVAAAENDYAGNIRGRVWLIFNEPDHPMAECGAMEFIEDSGVRVHRDPTEAAARYADVYDTIKQHDPYARVFAGGLVFLSSVEPPEDNTRWWWDTFLDTLETNGDLTKLDGVHVHAYGQLTIAPQRQQSTCPHDNCLPELAEALNDWHDNLHEADDRTAGLPIWITEVGWPSCGAYWLFTPEERQERYLWVRDSFMAPMSEWFYAHPRWSTRPLHAGVPSNPGYESMFWYTSYTDYDIYPVVFWCTFLNDYLSDPQGELTPAGDYWNTLPLPVLHLPLAMRNDNG